MLPENDRTARVLTDNPAFDPKVNTAPASAVARQLRCNPSGGRPNPPDPAATMAHQPVTGHRLITSPRPARRALIRTCTMPGSAELSYARTQRLDSRRALAEHCDELESRAGVRKRPAPFGRPMLVLCG
ncbi:hypothetical protein MRX96_010372 [Rhipicephalus microplus]